MSVKKKSVREKKERWYMFFLHLISDSNKVSAKRVIGLIALLMFIAYGVRGLFIPYDYRFWIFYISLCAITIWIAFRFMSSDKALKYNVIGELSKFSSPGNISYWSQGFQRTESFVDDNIIQDFGKSPNTNDGPPIEQPSN